MLPRSPCSDVPGSEVKIEFLSSKGQAQSLTLRRMKVEGIADRHQMFHLFTEVESTCICVQMFEFYTYTPICIQRHAQMCVYVYINIFTHIPLL